MVCCVLILVSEFSDSFCGTLYDKFKKFMPFFCTRLDAVEDLIARSSLIDQAREIMKQMPDLERLLRR